MNVVYIPRSKYITSSWTGGETSQILICPESASVSNQDFIYRISSATVKVDSNFTPYNNYKRSIVVLDNAITLNDNIQLKPLEPYNFNGSDNISSQGICTDFNLICNKNLKFDMQVIQKPCKKHYIEYNHYIIYSNERCELLVNNKSYIIEAGDSLAIYNSGVEIDLLTNEGYVIICCIEVK